MSIFKKILGRKNSVLSDKSIGTTTQSDLNDGAPETSPRQDLLTPRRRSNVRKDNLKDSIGYQPYFHKSVSSGSSSESVDSTGLEEAEAGETAISPSTTEDDILDEFVDNQSRRLVAKLQNLKKQRERLRRKQNDVISLEKEIRNVIAMISRIKLQTEALKEDELSKKLELKFLGRQVPEGCEFEARKKESVFYKKYLNLKTANDAKTLLSTLRQKLRILQNVELMTFNKYMDYKHGLKRDPVKKLFEQLSQKDKENRFAHITECTEGHKSKHASPKKDKEQTTEHTFTTVTIEPSPALLSSPEVTSHVASTPPAPPLPHNFGPFSLLPPRNETFL